MDFALEPEQIALRDAVRRFCDAEYPAAERGNAESPEQAARRHAAWAEMGLLGLPFAAEHGGSAMGAVEAMLVARELGRVLANGNWLSNACLAGPLIAELGSAEQKAQWLPPLVAGDLQAALALQEEPARHDTADISTAAQRRDGDWVLCGRKSIVFGGDAAALVIVAARTSGARRAQEGITLFAVDAAALRVQPLRMLDGRRGANIELPDIRIGDDRRLGEIGAAWPAIERAVARANAALCAEAAGALDALLALTAEHLKTRRQFGSPLARFQALQHGLADMALALEQIDSMACAAALALDAKVPVDRERLVSAAKALVGPLARRSAFAAIQMHGAMGMTDECRASHYARRLLAIGCAFGDADHHLQRFAALAP
ncbi:MAG: acyl-CoA dehydrogenase family protein, partial [Burkholderiales bacterium]|nr:acyl-CoA dehydrogenase family protein [Burkholderiales bacterium]